MLWIVSALLSVVLTAPADGGLLSSPDRRVRSTDRRIVDLLEMGIQRSPTFASLVKALNASDVIVYVERVRELPPMLAGRLVLLPIAGERRYLRIQVRGDLSQVELIALIGHELQHALEIASEPTVRDAPAMLTLYQRIGRPTAGAEHTFDTIAAQDTGRQVRQELAALRVS
jgi:hypothetical protein